MYSSRSILECYNLFSGVQLSTRSFCFITEGFLIFLLFSIVMRTIAYFVSIEFG